MDRYEKRRLALKVAVDNLGRGGIAKLSKTCDIDATYLSRLLYPEGKAGKKRIGEDVKEKIERALGNIFNEDYIVAPLIQSTSVNQDLAGYSNTVNLPLMNAVASMGSGNDAPDHEIVIDVLHVSRTWVERTLSITDIRNLSFIHAIGDSMSPTFNDGDILLVDTGDININADKIYALEAHNRLFIKRIRQRLDGVFEVSSDNPSIKTIDILNGDHEIQIKGRIVWVWNGRKV